MSRDRDAIYAHGYSEGLKDAPEIRASALRELIGKQQAALRRVRDLHRRWENTDQRMEMTVDCYACRVPWPCSTIRALDGAE